MHRHNGIIKLEKGKIAKVKTRDNQAMDFEWTAAFATLCPLYSCYQKDGGLSDWFNHQIRNYVFDFSRELSISPSLSLCSVTLKLVDCWRSAYGRSIQNLWFTMYRFAASRRKMNCKGFAKLAKKSQWMGSIGKSNDPNDSEIKLQRFDV